MAKPVHVCDRRVFALVREVIGGSIMIPRCQARIEHMDNRTQHQTTQSSLPTDGVGAELRFRSWRFLKILACNTSRTRVACLQCWKKTSTLLQRAEQEYYSDVPTEV